MDLVQMLLTDISRESSLEEIPLPPSSDVMAMLTHNLPPSDAFRSAVLAKIQQYERFIVMVNNSGHRLGIKDQSFFSTEKQKAESLLVSLKSIVHPLRYVPDDIVLDVLSVIVGSARASSVSTDTDLWACSRVCKRWRALVITTPSLWSDIHLNFDNDVYLKYHLSRAERILDERLQRSGSHLLDVFIRGPRKCPDKNRVLLRLLSSVTRWRSLTVDAGPGVYKVFEKCPRNSLKELRSLSITDSAYMDMDPEEEEDPYSTVVLKAFRVTPKLRRLFISPLLLVSLSLSANTLYKNIEAFSVSLFEQLSEVSELLPMMQALKSVDILCDERWEDDDDAIDLSLVSCITLRDYNDFGLIPETWNKLVLPNVTTLRLAYEETVFLPKLPQFKQPNLRIVEFTCSFDAFTGSDFPDFERELIVMLKALPNINILRLASYPFTPILLEEMRSDPHFLPSLTDVTLLWICSEVTDDELFLLIDMLHTRAVSATCATVKRIVLESEVTIYGGPTPHHIMWYDLQDSGLEVVESRDPLL